MKRKAILKDLASDERSSVSRKSSRQRRDSLKLIRLKQAQNKVSIEYSYSQFLNNIFSRHFFNNVCSKFWKVNRKDDRQQQDCFRLIGRM